MTDLERKRLALTGIAALLLLGANGAHAWAVLDGGVWARWCPVFPAMN